MTRVTRTDSGSARVEDAANRVVDVHKRLILGVTPGHPDWIGDKEGYAELFSMWHTACRDLRDVLGRSGEYV